MHSKSLITTPPLTSLSSSALPPPTPPRLASHHHLAPALNLITRQYQKLTNSADVRVRAALLVVISVANVTVGATLYRAVTGAGWLTVSSKGR